MDPIFCDPRGLVVAGFCPVNDPQILSVLFFIDEHPVDTSVAVADLAHGDPEHDGCFLGCLENAFDFCFESFIPSVVMPDHDDDGAAGEVFSGKQNVFDAFGGAFFATRGGGAAAGFRVDFDVPVRGGDDRVHTVGVVWVQC